jgi:hypothetical protein
LTPKRFSAWLISTTLLAAPATAQPVLLSFESRTEVAPPSPAHAATFGGLSGLDYDARTRSWQLLSDDTSVRGPSRMYTARISFGRKLRVRIEAVRLLTGPSGETFPRSGTGAESVDPESIRVDPRDGSLIWSSEGDAPDGFGPAVRRSTPEGREIARLALPPILHRDPAQSRGPRKNNGFEGIDVASDGGLWLAMETPLIQDGQPPSPTTGALIRISRLGPDGALIAQYAYAVDPIRNAVPGRPGENGVSEILALDDQSLLVLERTGIQREGTHYGFHSRIYLADLGAATDIQAIDSLVSQTVQPAVKTLVFDFDSLGAEDIGNLEGMAWAPRGRDAKGRLVLITDSNFDPKWPTQMLVLQVNR